MAENFLDQAPVGTKVFNKNNKKYYVKVNLGDRTIWKEARGSSITSSFRDLTIDKKGRKFTYKGETVETGDEIKDYLQSGKGMIQIKNSKYYNPANEELTGLKIGERRGEVYTIEDFKSKTGVDLQSRLTEGSDYRKYFNKNKKALNLKNEIERLERIPENRRGMSPNFDTNLQNLKNDLNKIGPIKPYKGESNSTPINKYAPTRKGVEFDLQASNNANKDLQIGIG